MNSKLLTLFAKIGLTLAALWFVFRGVDFAHLGDMLDRQNALPLLLTLIVGAAQILLCALRWRLILAAIQDRGTVVLPWAEAVRIYYISVFFNCCLPGTVGGDVVRVFLSRSEAVTLPLAIHSVIIDRLAALAGLGALVVITLPWLAVALGFNALPAVLAAIVAVIAGLWLLFRLDALLARFGNMRAVRALLYFAANLRLLLGHARAAVLTSAISVITQFSTCLCVYLLAKSLGAEVTLLQCTTFVLPIILATMLPISIGGWGVREAGMVTMLGLAGVPQATALIISVQLGFLGVLVALPGGLLWLAYRKRSQG